MISAHNDQGDMNRGKKWFSEKLPSHSRYVPPVSRAPASELVLQRGGLPSEIALPGGTSSPKLCIEARGRYALRNWDSDICPTHVPKKTTSVRNFDLISIQVSTQFQLET